MSYIEKHLIEGESVVYTTRLHWIVLLGPILLALLLGLPGLALLSFYTVGAGSRDQNSAYYAAAGAILIVVAVIFLAVGLVKRNATEMTVTNRRIVVKVGMAARRTVEMLLSRVESIGVEESVTGRVLGYGTVIVRGTGGTPESFDTIAHPLEFRTRVQEQIEKLK
ncbi:MAG: PH domain-containing protein [Acidobacteriia bacterium]|nr:PH domain-containing protein [Terriglobia bacterium]